MQVAYARTKEVPFVLILAGRFWTDETFYCVTVAADRNTEGVRVEDVQAAIARLHDMPDARALAFSMLFAQKIESPRATKYDDLVPAALRVIELARGEANIDHLRAAHGVRSKN